MIRIDSIVHIAFLILDLNNPGYFICSVFIICRQFIGKLFFKKKLDEHSFSTVLYPLLLLRYPADHQQKDLSISSCPTQGFFPLKGRISLPTLFVIVTDTF